MRPKGNNKYAGLFILFFCAILQVSAQKTFRYEASVQTVDSSGFYKIGLQPALIAKCNIDFSDIRLVDKTGHFIPYINSNHLPHIDKEKFTLFPEILTGPKIDTGTSFVIRNPENAPVNKLWVKLKNTSVNRTLNLSGSDDLKHWFAISEGIPLQAATFDSGGTYLQSLCFPASNYHYLKLLVNDKNKAPLKFLEAGIYTGESLSTAYFAIPGTTFAKKDSNKVTYVTIQLNDNYLINKISLDIKAPKYYKREVSIYRTEQHGVQLISDAGLNSNTRPVLLIDAKTNRLELQIENGDDSPLEISGIEAAQADQYIVSYLQAGQPYKLLIGDSKAPAPDYDLKFFTDSIHGSIPRIGHDAVVKNVLYNSAPAKVTKEYTAVIWTAIIIALLLLLLLTWKMAGEVNKKY